MDKIKCLRIKRFINLYVYRSLRVMVTIFCVRYLHCVKKINFYFQHIINPKAIHQLKPCARNYRENQ